MKKVIIVGGFLKQSNGATGGVVFACTSLVENMNDIEWIKIDSTATLPLQPIFIRLFSAIKRVIIFSWHCVRTSKTSPALIFSSDGTSFLEKGFMALISKFLGKRTIFAPRSGYLSAQLSNKLFKAYVIYVLKRVDTIICQGNAWKKEFQSIDPSLSNEKLVIVNNWIDLKHYVTTDAQKSKDGFVNMVFLGWVTKAKGIFDLIEAVGLIKAKAPNLKLYVCGDGVSKNEAERLAKELNLQNQIVFKGWVNSVEKKAMLNKADIFVLPSHAEGFPNSVLEAMALKIPVVVTNVGAVEDVLSTGANGLIVSPKSIKELAGAILKLYNDALLRNALGINGFETVKERFDISVAVQQFRKILS